MPRHISRMALVVEDYDKAIQFYTEKLNFHLLEDTDLGGGKRWVLVAPEKDSSCALLLAKAKNEEQASRIGNQTGGRVFLFMFTDDFHRDYNDMVEKGIEFVRPITEEPFGTVAVFKDLYGNLWDFIQPTNP